MSAETVTLEQQQALIEFLELHKELALGKFSRTKEGRSLSKRLWVECANLVNSVSVNCPTRGAEAWRTYYADYKSKLLKKIKKNKQELSGTGGGQYYLTALQERLYNILGRDVGEPLTSVRHNPLDVTFETEDGDGGGEMNRIEMPLDATISTSLSLGHEWPMASTSSAALDMITVALQTTTAATAATTAATVTTTAATATTAATTATTTAATAATTAATVTTTAATATTAATTATTTAATATTTATTATTTAATATTVPRGIEPPRQRRRYHHQEHEPEMTPLEAMESRNADATFALARSIERLADALDGNSRRPIEVVIINDNENQSRRHNRIQSSSDSE